MELRLEHLYKYYGKQCALDDFQASLTEGVYGLLGPNGAGKTTLISIVTGILKPNSGRILFDGTDIGRSGTRYLDKIGYLPQYPYFYKNFRVDEFLRYMCALKAIPKEKVNSRIHEVIEFVNLTEAYKKKIGALSGGMRQRLGIAQAILNEPELLILDEPTAGLDPGERIRFRNLISKLSQKRIVLLATHIVSDVEYIAKEIMILKKGSLTLRGEPKELEEKVRGKVWNVTADESTMDKLMEKYPVGNVKYTGDGFRLRIISEEQPGEEAVKEEPALEDLFLYLFHTKEAGRIETGIL